MGLNVVNMVVLGLCWGVTESIGAGEECEVCKSYLDKFYNSLLTRNIEFIPAVIEREFITACGDSTGKENRLCYYLGATSDAATRILSELTRPMSAHVPAHKICEKLRKIDMQICELKYDKALDLESMDLSKMKVADLRKILDRWGEVCRACIEKTDFVDLIKELAPKYVQKSHGSEL
ncbi:cerebral dopamine neurotrophic factor [Discoglossus pictus]